MTASEREEQARVLERLRRDARYLARRFGLELLSVDAERRQVKRRYGICYDDGSIKIRLHHARTGRLLKYSALVDTLCHELAHLKHFDHSPRFYAFYQRVLGYARRSGLYRPTPAHLRGRTVTASRVARAPAAPVRAPESSEPERSQAPVQLELFS
jgi:hypothetical protein